MGCGCCAGTTQSLTPEETVVRAALPLKAAAGKAAPESDLPETRSEIEALTHYTGLSSLRNFLDSGDVALIKASYFLQLASENTKFPRRQDIPEGSFADSSMLDRSFAELVAWDAFVKKPGNPFVDYMSFPPFVVVSYAWGSKDHPDFDGLQLTEVLAPAIEWYMAERAQRIRPDGDPHMEPILPLANSFDTDGCDFCIFLDYMSMYQHSPESHMCNVCKQGDGPCEKHRRTPEEKEAFGRALSSMDLLYGHQSTCVWRLTRHLEGYCFPEYSARGWPFFETTVSWLVKPAPFCLDLGTQYAMDALAQFEGRMRTAEELLERASYWSSEQPGTHGELLDARKPPILPDNFADEMKSKTLTNGSDRQQCIDQQRKVATAVLNEVEHLEFSHLGWDDGAARLLAPALPWCKRLQVLSIEHNSFSPEGVKAIADALANHTTVRKLVFSFCHVSNTGAIAISETLKSNHILEKLELFQCHIREVGAIALAEGLKVNNGLKILLLNQNEINDAGAFAIGEALKSNRALNELDLELCGICSEGGSALAEGLKGHVGLRKLGLDRNKLGDIGAIAIGKSLESNNILKELQIMNWRISTIGAMALITGLKGNVGVKRISFTNERIDDECVIALAECLKSNATLEMLSIHFGGNDGFGSVGAIALAEGLKVNSSLKKLDVAFAPGGVHGDFINANGARALADALKVNAGLEEVSLLNAKIFDAGAVALGESLKFNRTLKRLILTCRGIGPEGAKAFAEGVGVNNVLVKLSLYGIETDAEAMQALGQAMANRDTLRISGVNGLLGNDEDSDSDW